ncbi:uncharacterized protein LOC106874075 [Octopus bimaculoides]|uniref:Uncharacterized protein n=1 Tax=Octopus bimaculoides TaxID=37653 RepID=A0A0L8GXK3_OCTBM|nr:uncharacterized protein LOC106874075 [Octopus bimaculoides]|eukprot:XP_014777155.1 PREDICTED: uncharacterized protein LOC106874075 [Octopus bimaculoides]
MISASKLRDYFARLHLKLNIPLILVGVMFVMMTVNFLHQTSRISELEKRSIATTTSIPPTPRAVVQSGAIYTHWGKQNCTSRRSIQVYSGVAAGAHYTHSGSGSSYLCLPMKPQWGNYTNTCETAGAIYGVEYELSQYSKSPKFGMFAPKPYALHDQDVPCAVCETKRPASVMMIPARKECVGRWQKEYSGYLMSEYIKHAGRTEYICVDKEAEANTKGYENLNGALLYHVQAIVGSLPSPPYENNRELTCVVCSK